VIPLSNTTWGGGERQRTVCAVAFLSRDVLARGKSTDIASPGRHIIFHACAPHSEALTCGQALWVFLAGKRAAAGGTASRIFLRVNTKRIQGGGVP